MSSSTLARLVLAAALVVGQGSATIAQADPALDPTPPPIEVSVDCGSSPERVTITNNTRKPLKLKRVGSTHQQRSGEPYRVKKTLKPGKSVSFTFGTGKGKGKRLTGSFILDNDAPGEGVLVRTNQGKVRVRCVEGTNAPPVAEPVEVVEEPVDAVLAEEPVDALELLATLPVTPEVEEGYERERFEHWTDDDGDGCDTRAEVLLAESSTPAVIVGTCDIESGTWFSAADGDTLTNPASVDINHVVPLKEAWASGAHAWTPERRRAFANDLTDERTLQAVSAGANRQQGENDPASWLPANLDAACDFVRDWVAIKARWGLAVDQMERDAIRLTLESCGERQAADRPRGFADGSLVRTGPRPRP
ncbi:MAG: HNH endonuclease family protein [Candidatus Limnocylindrales bacterium]